MIGEKGVHGVRRAHLFRQYFNYEATSYYNKKGCPQPLGNPALLLLRQANCPNPLFVVRFS